MQFRLHINDNNDCRDIANQLRELADKIQHRCRLNHGFRRDLEDGYAIMEINAEFYPTCVDAEKKLGFTMEWKETNDEYIGFFFGHPHAKVKK